MRHLGLNSTLRFRGRIVCGALEGLIEPGMDVLDVGCGNGVISAMIRDRFGCNIMGTDILNYLAVDIPFQEGGRKANEPYYLIPHHPTSIWDVGLLIDGLHHATQMEQIYMIHSAAREVKRLIIIEPKLNRLLPLVDFFVNYLRHPEITMMLVFHSLENWLKIIGPCEYSEIKSPRIWPFDYYRFVVEA